MSGVLREYSRVRKGYSRGTHGGLHEHGSGAWCVAPQAARPLWACRLVQKGPKSGTLAMGTHGVLMGCTSWRVSAVGLHISLGSRMPRDSQWRSRRCAGCRFGLGAGAAQAGPRAPTGSATPVRQVSEKLCLLSVVGAHRIAPAAAGNEMRLVPLGVSSRVCCLAAGRPSRVSERRCGSCCKGNRPLQAFRFGGRVSCPAWPLASATPGHDPGPSVGGRFRVGPGAGASDGVFAPGAISTRSRTLNKPKFRVKVPKMSNELEIGRAIVVNC
jgi:hypothetical protein